MPPATIANSVSTELTIKKSRFLTILAPVTSMAEAEHLIATTKRRHWDARHHCTAVILGDSAEIHRSNDDGEPSGTAGVPMLETLRHAALTNVIAIVTRYFGGIRLGTGGLVRAYTSSVHQAVDQATILDRFFACHVDLPLPHDQAARLHGPLAAWCAEHGGAIRDVTYAQLATIHLDVPTEHLDHLDAQIAHLTGGTASATRGKSIIAERLRTPSAFQN